MTRTLGNRRAVLATGIAALAAVALSACSAGQVAETSKKDPSIYGVNAENADGSVLIRNLAVGYSSTKGYAADGSAPLQVSLFNQTEQPITVTITSARPAQDLPQVTWARGVTIAGANGSTAAATPSSAVAAPEPSGSRSATPAPFPGGSPSASAGSPAAATPTTAAPSTTAPAAVPSAAGPANAPAAITLAPLGSATFLADRMPTLQLTGLAGPLAPGGSVNLVFQFSNNVAPLTLQAGIAVPLAPAPRGSARSDGVGKE